jgi:hypothetical protein
VSFDALGFAHVSPCGEERCVGDGKCAAGRGQDPALNPLCGSCAEGFALWGKQCVPCSADARASGSGALFGFIVIGVLVVFVYHRLSRNASSSRIKIFVYFVQSALVILGTDASNVSASLEFLSVNPFRTGGDSVCLGNVSQFDQLMLGFVAPLFALMALALVLLASWVVWFIAGRRRDRSLPLAPIGVDSDNTSNFVPYSSHLVPHEPFEWSVYGASLIALYVLTYIPVVRAAFEFLNCVTVRVGGSEVVDIVFDYPAVSCSSAEWRNAYGFVVFMLVLWLGLIPCMLMWFLWREHLRVTSNAAFDASSSSANLSPSASTSLALSSMPSTMRTWVYAYLARAYRSQFFYYELVVLSRRTALLAVNVFLAKSESRLDRFLASIILNMLFLVIHMALHPMRSKEANVAEALSLLVLAVLPNAMAAAKPPLHGDSGRAVVAFLVYIPAILLAAWVAHEVIQRFRGSGDGGAGDGGGGGRGGGGKEDAGRSGGATHGGGDGEDGIELPRMM